MSQERQEGQCRCGAVRLAATGRPLTTMACHCRGCQLMTGGAFSLSSLYDWSRFEVTAGETVLGGLKGATRHFFCPSCLSWLFTRPEGMDDYVNIRSTMFEDPGAHRPYVDVHRREKVPGVETGAVEQFETVPANDRFGPLIGAYASWGEAAAKRKEERA